MFLRFVIGSSLVAVLVIAAGAIYYVKDLEEVPDQDLVQARLEIDPGENAFTLLEAARDALVWPEEPDGKLASAAARGDAEALEHFAQLVEENHQALDLVTQALSAPFFQVPANDWDDKDSLDYILSWNKLAKLVCMRGWLPEREGQPHGLASFAEAVEFGHRAETAHGGNLVHGMTGIAIKGIGLRAISAYVERHAVSPEQARIRAAQLNGFRTDAEAWSRIWATEYFDGKELMSTAFEEEAQGAKGLFFHPNRTFAGMAENARMQGEFSRLSCAQVPVTEYQEPLTESDAIKLYSSPNPIGNIMLRIHVGGQRRHHNRRCHSDTRIAAAQTLLGLRAHLDATGELPNQLSNLVPEYLDAVPTDAFDGEPLRYSRAGGLLYSVGDDFVDSGGAAQDCEDCEMREPRFSFSFGRTDSLETVQASQD